MGLFSLFHSEKFISSFLFVSVWLWCSYKSIVSQVTFYCKSRIIFSIEEPDIKWENFSFFWKINQLRLSDHTLGFSQNHQNCMLRENGCWEAPHFALKTEPQLCWGWQWVQLKTQLFQSPPTPRRGGIFYSYNPEDISQSLFWKSSWRKLIQLALAFCLLPFALSVLLPRM